MAGNVPYGMGSSFFRERQSAWFETQSVSNWKCSKGWGRMGSCRLLAISSDDKRSATDTRCRLRGKSERACQVPRKGGREKGNPGSCWTQKPGLARRGSRPLLHGYRIIILFETPYQFAPDTGSTATWRQTPEAGRVPARRARSTADTTWLIPSFTLVGVMRRAGARRVAVRNLLTCFAHAAQDRRGGLYGTPRSLYQAAGRPSVEGCPAGKGQPVIFPDKVF